MSFRLLPLLFLLLALSLPALALELPPGIQILKQEEIRLAQSVGLLAAFVAGAISLSSPCGFAILPTYFSFAFKGRKSSLLMTSAFAAGFVAALMGIGLLAGAASSFFNPTKEKLSIVAGVALIAFGTMTLLNKGFGGLRTAKKPAATFWGNAGLGAAFGVGWSPCIGAVLSGIIALGIALGNIGYSVLLMGVFGLGAAMPLFLISLFADRVDLARFFQGRALTFRAAGRTVTTHTYNLIAGTILVALGILMILYRGTFFFQTDFAAWIGSNSWTAMDWWNRGNLAARDSGFAQSLAGQIAGALLALAALALIVVPLVRGLRAKAARH